MSDSPCLSLALTFYRYRKIERLTRDLVASEDDVAAARQRRVRKKLYFMTLVVIVVALPLVISLLVSYIRDGGDWWDQPYDFNAVHYGPDPFNIYFISFTTSDMMNYIDLSVDYIGLVAGIVVFIPFGTTTEALNMYRKSLLSLGLGFIFPGLRREYQPSLRRGSRFTWWSSLTRSLRGKSPLTSTYDAFPPAPSHLASTS